MKNAALLPRLALFLMACQLLLMFASWLYSAAIPASGVHSLLSGEGLRWFMGHFAHVLATPVLVWLVLLAMAYGTLVRSGILLPTRYNGYRERRALWIAMALLAVYVIFILLCTVVPHAVLLSASGQLWPSPFSHSLVPVIAFGIMAVSMVYGTVAGTLQGLADVYDSLLYGIRQAAPLFLFYVLLTQFYYSLCFVLP